MGNAGSTPRSTLSPEEKQSLAALRDALKRRPEFRYSRFWEEFFRRQKNPFYQAWWEIYLDKHPEARRAS